MLADVHWRLGLLWQNWPYRLAQLVDPRCSQDEVRRLAEQILDLPTCCLDAACVRKLRRLYNGADDLLADGDFMDAVRLWSRRARCTNMHIERCVALLRTAVEDPAPNVERVAAAGFLSQVRAEHRKAGGKDVGLTTRKDFAREGLARPAVAASRVHQPGRPRGDNLHSCRTAERSPGWKRAASSLTPSRLLCGRPQWRRGAKNFLQRSGRNGRRG